MGAIVVGSNPTDPLSDPPRGRIRGMNKHGLPDDEVSIGKVCEDGQMEAVRAWYKKAIDPELDWKLEGNYQAVRENYEIPVPRTRLAMFRARCASFLRRLADKVEP